MSQNVFFWGSGEANSQTNSPQEATDRPNSVQTIYSVDCKVCRQYSLPIVWSIGYMTVSADCRLYGLQTVRSVDCMIYKLYGIQNEWFVYFMVYKIYGLSAVRPTDFMVCRLYGLQTMVCRLASKWLSVSLRYLHKMDKILSACISYLFHLKISLSVSFKDMLRHICR